MICGYRDCLGHGSNWVTDFWHKPCPWRRVFFCSFDFFFWHVIKTLYKCDSWLKGLFGARQQLSLWFLAQTLQDSSGELSAAHSTFWESASPGWFPSEDEWMDDFAQLWAQSRCCWLLFWNKIVWSSAEIHISVSIPCCWWSASSASSVEPHYL